VPQRVICQKCSFVLYEGAELKPPYEIVEGYEGRCPNCRKKLSYIPENIEIRVVDETRAWNRMYVRGN
jgi:RNase P subunit RPR2